MQIWCDLKYAKELYLWGVEQNSNFYIDKIGHVGLHPRFPEEIFYSTFVADELLRIMQKVIRVDSDRLDMHGRKYPYMSEPGNRRATWLNIIIEKTGDFKVAYRGSGGYELCSETDKILANACAKVFLYAIENRLTSIIYKRREK